MLPALPIQAQLNFPERLLHAKDVTPEQRRRLLRKDCLHLSLVQDLEADQRLSQWIRSSSTTPSIIFRILRYLVQLTITLLRQSALIHFIHD
jgi:hypothetical protein